MVTTLDDVITLLNELTTEFRTQFIEVKNSIKSLGTQIEGISVRVTANENAIKEHSEKIHTNIDDIKTNKHELDNLVNKVNKLEEDNVRLAKSLDEQIDRNMRETLIFTGISGSEKSWDETKNKLAQTLAKLEKKKVAEKDDQYTYDDFYEGIVRAHRGGKGQKGENKIFAKFSSQQIVDHVKTLSLGIKDIYINQMHSPMVNERLYNGRKLIKTLKASAASKTWKMHMNDRCQLMHKKPGDDRYVMYKQF